MGVATLPPQGPGDEIFLDMFEDEYSNESVSETLLFQL